MNAHLDIIVKYRVHRRRDVHQGHTKMNVYNKAKISGWAPMTCSLMSSDLTLVCLSFKTFLASSYIWCPGLEMKYMSLKCKIYEP